jgi:rubrerythrin
MKILVAVAVCLGLAFVAGAARTTAVPIPKKETVADLDKAMRGEAFAYARYMLYAKQARQSGNEDLARLFEDTARTEHLEHFAQEAKLAGLPSTNADNLQDAIQGESFESQTMYPGFARKAADAGDKAAADLFSEIARDETKHRDAFKAALDSLQKQGPEQQK